MNRAIKDYTVIPRTDWMLKWPGMVVLNGSQVHWTREVETDFDANGTNVESTNRGRAAWRHGQACTRKPRKGAEDDGWCAHGVGRPRA